MADKNIDRNSSRNSPISESEFRRVLGFLKNKRDSLIFSILYKLGLTVSEIVSLRVSQLVLGQNKLFLEDRTLSLDSFLVKKIESYLQDFNPKDYFFFTRQSPQITPRRVQQILKQVSRILGFELTPSSLRRQAIAKELAEKKDIEKIKEFSGLKNIREKAFLTERQFREFETQVDVPRDNLLFSLFYETGITVSQLSALKVKDVDIKKSTLNIKQDSRFRLGSRKVTLSHDILKKLHSFTKNLSLEDFIFRTRQSSHLTSRRIQQIFNNHSQKLDIRIKLTPQILRNSYLANILSAKDISETGLRRVRLYEYGSLSFAAWPSFSGKNNDERGGT